MLKTLLTDVDGTITDSTRRIEYRCGRVYPVARRRRDRGRPCEREYCLLHGCPLQNGGYKGDVHRRKRRGVPDRLTGTLHITGDQGVCRAALEIVQAHYRKKGIELDLYNPTYRYADLAFARTVPVEEVRQLLAGQPVQVIDTGFAIHLQSEGVSKGTALVALARDMGLSPKDFFAIGDGINDAQMLERAGRGVTIANAHPETKAAASDVMEDGYGKGFVQAVKKYSPYLRAR